MCTQASFSCVYWVLNASELCRVRSDILFLEMFKETTDLGHYYLEGLFLGFLTFMFTTLLF